MASNWALPQSIIQYPEIGAEESDISWLEVDNFSSLKFRDGKHTKTVRDLLHIARDPKSNIREQTYFLKLTNFSFVNLPDTLTGIELKLTMNRFGRITDETVQLTINDNMIGDNAANLDLAPIKIYGSDTSLWNTNLTISDVTNSSFGVVLRFQSHPKWPHKSTPLVDAIEIRVH